jgi:peptidoglycan/xylan/chitin deacetylase (PgdA/CDA1 family)
MRALPMMWSWIPILMFHEVVADAGTAVPPYGVTQCTLRAILHDFTRRGYSSGTLHDVVNGLSGHRYSQRKRLVLTFDDGTADFLEYALPVLQEFHFSATLFVVAGMLGVRRTWRAPGGGPPLAPVPLLTGAALITLATSGFTIGSHTLTHRALPDLPRATAAREITDSRNMLSDLLGQAVEWFAYPYVAASAETQTLVREAGYQGACGGWAQPHSRYYLVRLDAGVFNLAQLRLRSSGLFYYTRQALRRIRSQ